MNYPNDPSSQKPTAEQVMQAARNMRGDHKRLEKLRHAQYISRLEHLKYKKNLEPQA